MNLRLDEVLQAADRSLYSAEFRISDLEFAHRDSEQIVQQVRSQLVRLLCSHVVEEQILNDPDCIMMVKDLEHMATRIHARIYMMAPHTLRELLQRAFEAGQRSHW